MFATILSPRVIAVIAVLGWSAANAAHAGQTIKLAGLGTTTEFRGTHAPVANDADERIADGGFARDDAGNLYGTAASGGSYDRGTVYRLAPDGTKTVLHSFSGGQRDGATPLGGVIADAAGNLYGATSAGGIGCANGEGCGTIFQITPAGTERIVYTFSGGKDGATPVGNLVLGRSGHLYGTTRNGGVAGCGTVFEVSSGGAERVLHAFVPSEGLHATGVLHADELGNLYGATTGEHEALYRLKPDGTLTILLQFA
jgi:uncharacterized repeat protein (TIGR03803 family)